MSDLQKYYIQQAGTGLSGFKGIRYQKGDGFFGRLLSGAVYPLLRFLGKKILRTGSDIANDMVDSDDFTLKNLKTVASKNMKRTAQDVFEKAVEKMKGSGLKKWKKRKKRFCIKSKKMESIKGRRMMKTKKSVKRRAKKKYKKNDIFE